MVRSFVDKLCPYSERLSGIEWRRFEIMPNSKTHLIIGAATGAAVNAYLQFNRLKADNAARFDWAEIVVCSAVAGAAALLPDLLEPATTPNHRKFFHSVAMAALVTHAITGNHTKKCTAAELLLLTVVGMGYLSHLAADATTPKCISLI